MEYAHGAPEKLFKYARGEIVVNVQRSVPFPGVISPWCAGPLRGIVSGRCAESVVPLHADIQETLQAESGKGSWPDR